MSLQVPGAVVPFCMLSFPTRRSSDLGFRGNHLRDGGALRRRSLHGDNRLLFLFVLANYACATRDRKSTRLNSSHGYISYAVFCLKKNTYFCNVLLFSIVYPFIQ